MPIQTKGLSDVAFVLRGDPKSTTFVPHQTTLTKLDGGAKFETHTKEHCTTLRTRIYESLQFQQRWLKVLPTAAQSLFIVQTVAQIKAGSKNALTKITLENHNWLLEKYRLLFTENFSCAVKPVESIPHSGGLVLTRKV